MLKYKYSDGWEYPLVPFTFGVGSWILCAFLILSTNGLAIIGYLIYAYALSGRDWAKIKKPERIVNEIPDRRYSSGVRTEVYEKTVKVRVPAPADYIEKYRKTSKWLYVACLIGFIIEAFIWAKYGKF